MPYAGRTFTWLDIYVSNQFRYPLVASLFKTFISRAHGYTSGNYRAVLLNRVVVGLQATYTGATGGGYVLPAGYDSVSFDCLARAFGGSLMTVMLVS